MKLFRKSRLTFQQGKSDKVYEVDLVETTSGDKKRYLVNFRYGRRGSNLREGTKTAEPVDFSKAEKLFDSIVIAKVNKGYIDNQNAERGHATRPNSNALQSRFSIDEAGKTYLTRLAKLTSGTLDSRQAKRFIWRLGEVGFTSAESELNRLIGKKDDSYDYVLAWSLGRLNANSSYNQLLELAKESRSDETKRIALEAALWVANDESRQSLLNNISGQLPVELSQIVKLESIASTQEITHHETVADATNAYFRYLETNPNATDLTLVIFYQLALSKNQKLSAFSRTVIKESIFRLPLKPPYFKAFRHLFKIAEFRLDGEIYGLIGQKFDRNKASYFISGWSEYTIIRSPEYQWVNIADEQKKPESGLAYSNKTRNYLRRRTWRALRRLGEAHDSRYVKFAMDILLTYDELCAEQAKTSTRYNYDPKTWQRMAGTTTNYDQYASQILLNHLIRANHPGFCLSKSGQAWQRTSEPELFSGRGEAFPELWDEEPQALLALLCQSKLLVIQNFSAQALMDHQEFCSQLAFDEICQLLKSDSLPAQQLAIDTIQSRLAKEKPTTALLVALSACQIEEGRHLAISWLNDHLSWLKEHPEIISTFLLIDHQDIQQWVSNIAVHLQDIKSGQIVVNELLEIIIKLYQDNSEETALLPVFERLKGCFNHILVKLDPEKLELLFLLPSIAIQVFAAKLLEANQCPVDSLSPVIFKRLVESPNISLKLSGVALFSKLNIRKIADQQDLLLSFCLSNAQSVRLAAHKTLHIFATGAPKEAAIFHRLLIDQLFRSEPYDGVHQDLITLLCESFSKLSKSIEHQLFWRLSQAKSLGAKQFAAAIIDNFNDQHFSIRQWAVLADQESKLIRDRAINFYLQNVTRVKSKLIDALPLLNCKWKDSKDFAIDYFKTQFSSTDWTADVLIGICDNTDPALQDLGRELILNHFDKEKGQYYLERLSQHPSVKVQQFVTQLLPDFAGDNQESMLQLQPYFITVLSQVNKGRTTKNRVLQFLLNKAKSNQHYAELTANILSRVSGTAAIQEKAQYLTAMRDLKLLYPSLDLPIKLNTKNTKLNRKSHSSTEAAS